MTPPVLLLALDVGLLAMALAATMVLLARGWRARRRVATDLKERLASEGLQTQGDVLGTFIARSAAMANVVVTNRTPLRRPGSSEQAIPTCVARVAVPLEDQIVCVVVEVEAVQRAFPALRRVRTDYAPFDYVYAVFVSPSDRATTESYRAVPLETRVPWTLWTSILQRLLELNLLWLRIHNGNADIVFPPLEIEDVGRAIELTHAIEREVAGRSVPSLRTGPRVIREPEPDAKDVMALIWGVGVFLGFAVGMLVATLPPLRWVNSEAVCGTGDRIINVDTGDGWVCQCEQTPEKSVNLHSLGAILLGISVVVNTGLWRARKKTVFE